MTLLCSPFVAWLVVDTADANEQPSAFRLIVHPKNPMRSAPTDFLSNVFLKKVTRWEDGETAHPVDQRPGSMVRVRFSEIVLKRSVASVRSYWQQRIFSGRGVPPPAFDSDEAVVGYVQRERGAIGYVSQAAKLDGVKVLALQ